MNVPRSPSDPWLLGVPSAAAQSAATLSVNAWFWSVMVLVVNALLDIVTAELIGPCPALGREHVSPMTA